MTKAQTATTGRGQEKNDWYRDSNERGVDVTVHSSEEAIAVQFAFNPRLVAEIRRVEGATFDKESNCWIVPGDQREAMDKAVSRMRDEFVADEQARADIEKQARTAAKQIHKANGVAADVAPQISAFHRAGEPSAGEVICANAHYAAQYTGQGARDGAAFIKLHRVADLSQQVFKGEFQVIDYSDKGRGDVTPYEPFARKQQRYEESLGKVVDGVKVTEVDGQCRIEFDYNPALAYRMGRIEGAEFNKDAKVWTLGVDKRDLAIRAVSDMRQEVVADRRERDELAQAAQQKLDGAVVKDAYTKEGQGVTGKVMAVGERYVLQHSGKEYAALHRIRSLDAHVEAGDNVRIEYGKGGKAKVQPREHSRANER